MCYDVLMFQKLLKLCYNMFVLAVVLPETTKCVYRAAYPHCWRDPNSPGKFEWKFTE